ncbi:MAG TPA: ATP-binding protein [Steroidobacteraceae bacterium]|nr:ATP-binding protein [Steroidobacteraceae bacterium]
MATGDQLRALLRSYIDGDEAHFFSIAMQLAAAEARQGHGKVAEELRALIDEAKSRRLASANQPIPISRPRGELASLLRVSYPKARLSDLVLTADVHASLQRIVKEQRHLTKLLEHGLAPRRKILLVGSPGTGKTLTASALAGELGVPLFVVRLDALLTKFMGETAAKLRQIFDSLAAARGVYFFDEFDAIGGERIAANDVGEVRRILNSFLVMIEEDTSNSLILAATNHPEILDRALFRRFDDVIEYDLPNARQIESILLSRLGRFAPKDLSARALARATVNLSHADVTRAAEEAVKNAVMHDLDFVDTEELQRLLTRRPIKKRRQGARRKKR